MLWRIFCLALVVLAMGAGLILAGCAEKNDQDNLDRGEDMLPQDGAVEFASTGVCFGCPDQSILECQDLVSEMYDCGFVLKDLTNTDMTEAEAQGYCLNFDSRLRCSVHCYIVFGGMSCDQFLNCTDAYC